MKFSIEQHFAADVDAVARAYTDPELYVALDGLRRLGVSIAELERDRLRALAAFPEVPAVGPEVEEARRALEVHEAERELELELL